MFSFDLGPKRGISQQLFAYFLHDWWNRRFHSEETAPVREVVGGAYSPGRILKMSEAEIVRRLADLANLRGEAFTLTESASLRQVRREWNSDGFDELRAAYESPRFL